MADKIINDLLPKLSHDPPESDMKRQKLIECVITRNSKQYLGKGLYRRTDEQAQC